MFAALKTSLRSSHGMSASLRRVQQDLPRALRRGVLILAAFPPAFSAARTPRRNALDLGGWGAQSRAH